MTEVFLSLEIIDRAADAIRHRTQTRPRLGMILGSGLNAIADAVQPDLLMPYAEIPGFAGSTVQGHVGRLVVGRLEGHDVMVMQGRVHFYEGVSISQVGLPVRVMQVLGIETLVVTNAAGGLNPAFVPGDVMLIRDHINLIGMAGLNPLRGPNLDSLGPRFPDMSAVYDPGLRALARAAAGEAGIDVQEGVYICLSGPSFETPADIRFLRTIGADAVGMSTVPEATVARHGGMRTLGISGITNVAMTDAGEVGETTHEEVLEAGKLLAPRIEAIIRGTLARL